MPIYIITGRLGSGKSLATVGRIRDLLAEGRAVATRAQKEKAREGQGGKRGPVHHATLLTSLRPMRKPM